MAHARQRARYGDSMTTSRPIPRNAPSDAAAERALWFAPAVPRRSVGPHAWSRARVDRLAPRKEPKLSGEGSPFTLHCAPASPFLTPKSWYVGVRGILWPYAGFPPFKFRWGRERAPSILATGTRGPLFPRGTILIRRVRYLAPPRQTKYRLASPRLAVVDGSEQVQALLVISCTAAAPLAAGPARQSCI